ncbi:MAG TPA: hypothetical protein VGD84_17370, partial [Pseudonocardiaceae bacterium]
MTKFADQLFSDLMAEYQPALERIERPAVSARRAVPRPVWLAAGVVGMAGAITGGIVALGGSPAYAVTRNGDGTVTISLSELSGVDGANGKLHNLGLPVVVVPTRPGCPAVKPALSPASHQLTSALARTGKDGSITVDVRGVPAGDT